MKIFQPAIDKIEVMSLWLDPDDGTNATILIDGEIQKRVKLDAKLIYSRALIKAKDAVIDAVKAALLELDVTE